MLPSERAAINIALIAMGLFVFSACSYPYDDDTALPQEGASVVADAGADQDVLTGVVVTLDGSSSSGAANASLSYSWSFTSLPADSTATLSSADDIDPTFAADVDGTYVLELVVSDESDNSASDTVMISASEDAPPVANAGSDQQVSSGAVVTLDGSGSSGADNATLSYSWSFTSVPASSTATLSSADSDSPSFTADADGTYVLELLVNDGSDDSTPDTVTITASASGSSGVSFSGDIQPIFDAECTVCHFAGGGEDDDFLALTSDVSYSRLVDQPASNTPNTLVVPGDSSNSELYLRVSGTSTGSRMPTGGQLSDADQELIRTWIDDGAANN
ncbi:MAG: PKD domain-containing protein [Desulfobacterales bacterium]